MLPGLRRGADSRNTRYFLRNNTRMYAHQNGWRQGFLTTTFSSWPKIQFFHIMRRSKLVEIDLKAQVNEILIDALVARVSYRSVSKHQNVERIPFD
jgi:hypothetical protein